MSDGQSDGCRGADDCGQADAEPTARLLCAPASQILQGHQVGVLPERVYCTGCNCVLREGQPVVCYAYQCVEADQWAVPYVYCEGCAPDAIRAPTLGASEMLVTAVLASVSLPADRTHRLCLYDVVVVVWSPPTEGSQP